MTEKRCTLIPDRPCPETCTSANRSDRGGHCANVLHRGGTIAPPAAPPALLEPGEEAPPEVTVNMRQQRSV